MRALHTHALDLWRILRHVRKKFYSNKIYLYLFIVFIHVCGCGFCSVRSYRLAKGNGRKSIFFVFFYDEFAFAIWMNSWFNVSILKHVPMNQPNCDDWILIQIGSADIMQLLSHHSGSGFVLFNALHHGRQNFSRRFVIWKLEWHESQYQTIIRVRCINNIVIRSIFSLATMEMRRKKYRLLCLLQRDGFNFVFVFYFGKRLWNSLL